MAALAWLYPLHPKLKRSPLNPMVGQLGMDLDDLHWSLWRDDKLSTSLDSARVDADVSAIKSYCHAP